MINNVVDIYYFSGTGNTLLAIRELTNALKTYGKTVNLYKMETSNPEQADTTHTIGLAFPVAVFSTYPFVWQFIENLPNGRGTEVFMLSTLGGFSGGIIGPLKKLLLRKSYWPIGAKEFIMPGNLNLIKPDAINARKIAKALPKIRKYAHDLASGTAKWYRIPLLSDFIRLFSKSSKPWQAMSKNITIDKSACSRCGLCVKLCPVKNIEMQEYPIKHNNCQVCMRCASFCPKGAINHKDGTKKYKAVTANELLE